MVYLQNARGIAAFFFILISIYCSYTDIKERRIKNWLLGCGIVCGFCFYIFSYLKPVAPLTFFLNIIIAIILAFLIWRLNVWAAGDGKFFIFSSVFIYLLSPSNIFTDTQFNLPIILVILANAFILALLYIFLQTVIAFFCRVYFAVVQNNLGEAFNNLLTRITKLDFILLQLKILFFYLAVLILVSILKNYILTMFKVQPKHYFFLYVLLFFVYPQIRKFITKIKIYYLVLGLFLTVFLFKVDMLSIAQTAFRFFIFLGILRSCINWYIQKEQIKIISPEELKPHMLLATQEITNLPSEQQPRLRFFSDGLTIEQAKNLSSYFKSKKREAIKIYNTFPFVPFIFISLITTYFLKGRLLNILFFLY